MLKNNLLLTLILSFLFSLKSLAVPYPEYINWRAEPREFVISLYEGLYGSVTENNTLIDNMALRINSDPNSRLELFWLFIDSSNYSYSMWATQKKEYQVYFEYVLSGNVEKYKYYVAKKPTGADMFTQGIYTFGVAMALRDFWATYIPRSIEYGEIWNFVPRYLRSPPDPTPDPRFTDPPPPPEPIGIDPDPLGSDDESWYTYDPNPVDPNPILDPDYYIDPNLFVHPTPYPDANPVPSGTKCPLNNLNGSYLILDSNNNPNDKTQIKCNYYSNGLLRLQNPEVNGILHGEYIEHNFYKNIHYVKIYGYYNYGRKDGVWETYHLPNNYGNIVLASQIKYNDGVKILEEFYDSRDFLSKRIQYLDGKKSEVTNFYDTGKPSSYSTYNSSGTRLTYKSWYKDGREK